MPPPPNAFKATYVPALDGLRGVAIVAILIFHLDWPLFTGSFIGVDIFFVLSGFLITSLLVYEFDASARIHLGHFYLRRVLRLGPALMLMLAVYSAVCLVVLPGAQARDHLIDAAIAFFYVSNWARALGIHPPDFLGHTWSLGIEEQFYLAWPLILYALLRAGTPRWRIASFAIGIALACWLTRIGYLLGGKTIERIYNGLDTRADCLMIGCALGTVLASGLLDDAARVTLRRGLRVATPLMVLWLVAFGLVADWQSRWIYYWGLATVALAAATLILDVLIDPRGRVAAALSSRWLVFTGSISYGLYLWHYPIYRGLAALDLNRLTIFFIGVPATFAIATLSYRFLERPILNLARPSAWRSAKPGAFGRSAAATARD